LFIRVFTSAPKILKTFRVTTPSSLTENFIFVVGLNGFGKFPTNAVLRGSEDASATGFNGSFFIFSIFPFF
jgi:hypothetical protein